LYPRILVRIVAITFSLSLNNLLKQVHDIMKENIKNSTENINLATPRSETENKDAIKVFSELFKELNELAQVSNVGKLNSDVNNIFKDDWGVKLWNYVSSNNYKLNQGNFFALISVDTLISAIIDGTSCDISHLIYSFDSIYRYGDSHEHFKRDSATFAQLVNELEELTQKEHNFDAVKKYNIKRVIEFFTEMIDKYSKEI